MTDKALNAKILVVEDEVLLAKDISLRLEEMNYEVVSMVHDAESALNAIEKHSHIDVVLLDIVLNGDLDGIELAQIVKENYAIPCIFLTSYSYKDFIVRANDVRPGAYILKPFNDRQISVAIEMTLIGNPKNDDSEQQVPGNSLTLEPPIPQIKDSLFLKKDHHFLRVPLSEILYLEADSNYTNIFTISERYVYSTVLKKIEVQLPRSQFLRVHRSYIVNIQSIRGYQGNMVFVGDEKIPVSSANREVVFKLFKTL
ncbi:response regulator transcription factor [Fulvivirga sp. M361]|uniref:LytR/AlgR family response regulator transcription factor n=1 Tax=Fulvivirga sp. M361 TaxID=2594266 RepID=UPI00117B5139|nr:LytTR family transcriptional regulator DNA-binding domain-containing protein [Fulvivirga sp. M361]TRX54841.1 response regulator transcription factor [Fulvivirga sp. M361]